MKRADYVPVYGRRPWLMSEDLPEAGDYFREHGAAFHLARREQIRFGRDPRIFWIENGLCATFPTTGGEMPRFIGLFGRRTLLGGVRSLGHLGERMEITAVALAEVSGFSVPAPMFRTWVAAERDREQAVMRSCIAKAECQLEGVLVNDLCSVPDRVLLALDVLAQAAGVRLDGERAALPWDITVTEISQIVHAERGMVSKAVSALIAQGVVEKEGRRLVLTHGFLPHECLR